MFQDYFCNSKRSSISRHIRTRAIFHVYAAQFMPKNMATATLNIDSNVVIVTYLLAD